MDDGQITWRRGSVPCICTVSSEQRVAAVWVTVRSWWRWWLPSRELGGGVLPRTPMQAAADTRRWKSNEAILRCCCKRVTHSLGRSRDNWRNHYIGVNLSIYCVWYVHIVGRLLSHVITADRPFRPISDFKTHFKWHKPTLTIAMRILSAPFSRNVHLLPPYFNFKRPYRHLGVMRSFASYVTLTLFDGTFCWCQ